MDIIYMNGQMDGVTTACIRRFHFVFHLENYIPGN